MRLLSDSLISGAKRGLPILVTSWQPHLDWWDIKTIVNTGVTPWAGAISNVRYAFVLNDSTIDIVLPAGYQYYTSDGQYYADGGTHTWDVAYDKPCATGYVTRCVVVCGSSRDVEISQKDFPSLYVYLGDCNVTSFSFGYPVDPINRVIQAIKGSIAATASEYAIGSSSFQGCYALESVEIPSGAINIAGGAFQECYNLSHVTIPNTVTSIYYAGFNYCVSLMSIELPSSITEISENVFQDCYSLNNITLPSGLAALSGNVFSRCYSLSSIDIPTSVITFGSEAFGTCFALTSAEIPSGVTSFSSNAFQFCFALNGIKAGIDFDFDLNLRYSSNLSISSIITLFGNLKDNTGETAKTITLNTRYNTLLTATQKAIATNKNWTLAYV